MFTEEQLLEIKKQFEDRFDSLERDSYRAFTAKIQVDHSFGMGAAPFPITLYCMSALDYFSGLYAGYSEKRDESRLSQTDRMVKFAHKFLRYNSGTSKRII